MKEETKFLYGAYKEYAWREYDLLEKRANWLYVANSLLLAALIYLFQQRITIVVQENALKRVGQSGLLAPVIFMAALSVVVIPITAIVFDAIMWREMVSGTRALEEVRIRWREARLHLDGSALPQMTYGFRDKGNKVTGLWISSILPAALILFWLTVLSYGLLLLFHEKGI